MLLDHGSRHDHSLRPVTLLSHSALSHSVAVGSLCVFHRPNPQKTWGIPPILRRAERQLPFLNALEKL